MFSKHNFPAEPQRVGRLGAAGGLCAHFHPFLMCLKKKERKQCPFPVTNFSKMIQFQDFIVKNLFSNEDLIYVFESRLPFFCQNIKKAAISSPSM